MEECETGTGKNSFVKRVSVRSGGAGHAQSGVVRGSLAPKKQGAVRNHDTSDEAGAAVPARAHRN
jgi:hypothetical protein